MKFGEFNKLNSITSINTPGQVQLRPSLWNRQGKVKGIKLMLMHMRALLLCTSKKEFPTCEGRCQLLKVHCQLRTWQQTALSTRDLTFFNWKMCCVYRYILNIEMQISWQSQQFLSQTTEAWISSHAVS